MRKVVLLALIYAAINAGALFAPRRPGTDVFVLWGFIFPVIAVAVTWTHFAKNRLRYGASEWIMAAAGFTIAFAFAGIFTVLVCAEALAAV